MNVKKHKAVLTSAETMRKYCSSLNWLFKKKMRAHKTLNIRTKKHKKAC